MRVGMFRPTEILYNGKAGRLVTLRDLEISDKSVFELKKPQETMRETLGRLRANLEKIPYWSCS